MGRLYLCNLFRGALSNNLAATIASLRSKVHDPVGGLDHVQVVLDDDDSIAMVTQVVQHREQLFDVMKVQAGGGFIENIQGLAGVALGQFPGQFYPLRLATGQRGRSLTQAHIG